MNKALKAYDCLYAKLDEANSVICTLAAEEQFSILGKHIVAGTLSAVEDLIEQAQQAGRELWEEIRQQRKPDAPVMMDGEPIRNLEKELIAVLREVVEKIGLAESRGSYLLDHIDESRTKRDKTA